MKTDIDSKLKQFAWHFHAAWSSRAQLHPSGGMCGLLLRIGKEHGLQPTDIWEHLDVLHARAKLSYDTYCGANPQPNRKDKAAHAEWMEATEPARAIWRWIQNEKSHILQILQKDWQPA